MLSSFYLLTLGVVVVLGLSLRKFGRRDHNLPPGPPTPPLLGNLHVFPRKNAYLQQVYVSIDFSRFNPCTFTPQIYEMGEAVWWHFFRQPHLQTSCRQWLTNDA